MSARERFPPVLTLGTSRVCLAIARSLAARGVPVDVAASARDASEFSKAVRAVHRLPDFEAAPEYFLDRLLALLDSRKYELILPASDTALSALSRFYEPLSERARLGCPSPEILDRVLRKDETLRIAVECGVPVPATMTLAEALAPGGREDLVFPLIAKPGAKYSAGAFKTRRLESYEQLECAVEDEEGFDDETLLQAYAPGEGVGIETLMHRGEPLLLFQHRRLKELPYAGGVSVLAVSETVDAVLAGHSLRLLRALEWEGPAMVEFRHDRVSGAAALMEVNGRLWGSLPLSIAAGVDFPYLCWQSARGETPSPPREYRIGVRARWAAGDLRRVCEIFARSRRQILFREIRGREFHEFLGDFDSAVRDMVWSARDPGPAVYELISTSLALLKETLRGLAKKAIPLSLRQDLRMARGLGGATGRHYLRSRAATWLGRRRQPRPLPARTQSILFVCHGNIIRSALAEALVKAEAAGAVRVASAGVGAQPGRQPDERACAAARELGITLDGHRARAVTDELLAEADIVFVMDELNEAFLLARHEGVKRKLRFLGEWNPRRASRIIVDPYRGSLGDVRACGLEIEACAAELARALKKVGQQD
jgi:protein-tyrosine-phosphatase/predicted ATP-grasp superfamily ATP-dependent carboligase